MLERYERNIGTITQEENERLKTFQVCVVGCGGLGGHVIENLARLGIGHLTVIDGDVFQASNLNRQILSTEQNLGQSKAEAARERVAQINSQVGVCAINGFLNEFNSRELIRRHHVVVDALDNIPGRLLLEKACEEEGIPLVHGAIAGWYGQVAVVMPGDRLLRILYAGGQETELEAGGPESVAGAETEARASAGAETDAGNPAFTPAAVAALETAEALKVLLGRPQTLRKKLLTADLLNQSYEVVEL